MRCPYCAHEHVSVLDSRETADNATRRRRECRKCRRRFTTYERIESSHLVVVKKDGRREPFDRRKILDGVMRACSKRDISVSQVEELVARVEAAAAEKGPEVRSSLIGQQVMRHLRRLDKVAYLRFASVYRGFEDIGSFEQEAKRLR